MKGSAERGPEDRQNGLRTEWSRWTGRDDYSPRRLTVECQFKYARGGTRLRDEALLLRVGSRYVKRHSFTGLRDSIGCLHAEGRHEDSSTLNGEKHPQVGHEIHFASYRDEFAELHFYDPPTGGPCRGRSRVLSIGGFPYVAIGRHEKFHREALGFTPSWESRSC